MKVLKFGLFLLVVCLVGCAPAPKPSTFTSVVVINSSGAPVPGAEVFQDGVFKGVTDGTGTFVFSPALPGGTRLFARNMVFRQPSYRVPGGWVARFYQTSRVVNTDGSVTDLTVGSPKATQTLTVSPNNTLIGWHLTVNLDWDASDDEFKKLKDYFTQASQYLYNLTDGQFFIEQVDIADDGQLYLAAEIQFKVDSYVWPHATYPGGFLGSTGGLPHIYMAPFSDYVIPFSNPPAGSGSDDPRTLVHELGHLALGLGDEYVPFANHCTAVRNLPTTATDFKKNGALAACFMDSQFESQKMCSAFASSVHATGNWQLDPCWATVYRTYSDPGPAGQFGTGVIFQDRWIIRTPDARGAMVGTLPPLPPELQPDIKPDNKVYPGLLCEPVTVSDWHGAAAADGTVWVHPQSWRNFDYTVGRLDQNGKLVVRGLHQGDLVQSPFAMLTAPCVITQ